MAIASCGRASLWKDALTLLKSTYEKTTSLELQNTVNLKPKEHMVIDSRGHLYSIWYIYIYHDPLAYKTSLTSCIGQIMTWQHMSTPWKSLKFFRPRTHLSFLRHPRGEVGSQHLQLQRIHQRLWKGIWMADGFASLQSLGYLGVYDFFFNLSTAKKWH